MLSIVKHNLSSVGTWQQHFLCGADRFLCICSIWDVQKHSFPQKGHCWVSSFSCCIGYQKGWRAKLLVSWAPTGLGRMSWWNRCAHLTRLCYTEAPEMGLCCPHQNIDPRRADLSAGGLPEQPHSGEIRHSPSCLLSAMRAASSGTVSRLSPETWAGASAERNGIYPSPGTV